MVWQVFVVAVFFLSMGVAAFISPRFVVGRFGLDPATPEARNEVRAVYGGFGVAVAGILIAAAFIPTITPGVTVAVAASLIGMALGRLVAVALEGLTAKGLALKGFALEGPGRWPALFLVVELILAGLLLSTLS